MTELKPCPFCGGEARLSKDAFGNTILEWVYCTSCGAQCGNGYTEAEAINAWNIRAERTCKNDDDDCDAWFKCSECGLHSKLEIMSGGYGVPNYCPNCGAKVVD